MEERSWPGRSRSGSFDLHSRFLSSRWSVFKQICLCLAFGLTAANAAAKPAVSSSSDDGSGFWGLSQFSAAVGIAAPISQADTYQTYEPLTSIVAETWFNLGFLGPLFRPHISLIYHGYDVRHSNLMRVIQLMGLFGIEASLVPKANSTQWLRPFTSFDFGVSGQTLLYRQGANFFTNWGASAVFQWRNGFSVDVWKHLWLDFSVPILLQSGPVTWQFTVAPYIALRFNL